MPPRAPSSTSRFRLLVRQVLYRKEKNAFGCDRQDCACRRHLRDPYLDEAPVETQLIPRLRHIIRIEGMINVGCHFGPNDLEWDQWEELQVLAMERQWIQERVRELRDLIREDTRQAQDGMAEARQAAGVAGPGQSLFGGKAASSPKRR